MWRLLNIFRGLFSLGVKRVEIANPKALLEVEKENFRKSIGQYNDGLANHAGLCERLMSQVKTLESEQRDLQAKTAAHLKAGNTAAAGSYALRLQTITRELEENKAQAANAETTYKNLLKTREVTVAAAKAKLEAATSAITDMEIKKATARMMEQASGMITSIGGSGDTMDRLTSMVNEQREQAAGRARVAQDSMDMSEVNLKEAEQAAFANQALAEFAAKNGMVIPDSAPKLSAPSAVPTIQAEFTRTMG